MIMTVIDGSDNNNDSGASDDCDCGDDCGESDDKL